MEAVTENDTFDMGKATVIQLTQHTKIYLEDLFHAELQLIHPIPIFIETEGDTVIANYPPTVSYGCGEAKSEALDDLRLELVDLYNDLLKNSDHLGPLPQKWWNHLQTIIQRRA